MRGHLASRISGLDADAFESALGRWAQECLGEGDATIGIDGKALRGIHGRELPGVRLVAAYAGESGLVLGQKGAGVIERRVNWVWPPPCWPNWSCRGGWSPVTPCTPNGI